jgi:hypothetical protein
MWHGFRKAGSLVRITVFIKISHVQRRPAGKLGLRRLTPSFEHKVLALFRCQQHLAVFRTHDTQNGQR